MFFNSNLLVSLAANIISSVGVIFINKRLVFLQANYPFGTALTIIHFVVTFLGCLLFAWKGVFNIKKLSLKSVTPISLAFCGYVAFNNMSLLKNSVAMYQISKIAGTPLLLFIERVLYGVKEPSRVLLSLIPVCLGIFLTVYSDSEVTLEGIFWATLALIANAFYTIWGKTKQIELDVTPMQILTYQAPLSAFFLLFALPILDPLEKLVDYDYTCISITVIALSSIFAFGVNFSFFLFVGQTSPLTMNVVGYLKTCLVFIGGFIFFDTEITLQVFIGITMTLFGLGLYSRAKLTHKGP
eukprot:Tbor_TRINITY_DN2815_c0_g1::TRINITY_DN2815_c0_g1_i1::g.23160::m.23160/K15285/SLC35E3; solute carrier family 35, member E3